MTTELKPCPFCGGDAEIHTEEGRLSGELVCGGCGVMFRSSNRDALPRFWNARCVPTEEVRRFHPEIVELAKQTLNAGTLNELTLAVAILDIADPAYLASNRSPPVRSMDESRAIGLLRVVRDEWYRHTPYSELKASIDGLLDAPTPQVERS